MPPRGRGKGSSGAGKKRPRHDDDDFAPLDLDVPRPSKFAVEEVELGDEEDRLVHNKGRQSGQRKSLGIVAPSDAHKGIEVDENEEGVEAEEEELAREANKVIRSTLSADDFALPGLDIAPKATQSKKKKGAKGDDTNAAVVETVARDFSHLTDSEQLRMVQQQSPEVLKLLEEFRENLQMAQKVFPQIEQIRAVLSNQEKRKKLGEASQTASLLNFLDTKVQLLLSYCIHINFYLLLKAEGKPVEGHPVVDRLIEIRVYLEKLWPLEQKLQYTLNKLLSGGAAEAGVKVTRLRPVTEEDGGVYKPLKSSALDSDVARRRQDVARQRAEELDKEEEGLMVRVRGKGANHEKDHKKAKKALAAIDEAAVEVNEPQDHFFSRVVHGDSEDDDEEGHVAPGGGTLLERLRARQQRTEGAQSKLQEQSSSLGKSKSGKKKTVPMDLDDFDGDDFDGEGMDDDIDEDEYERLLAEEAEEAEGDEDMDVDGEFERPVADAPATDRRAAGKRIEKNRGLTKSRPKDRKTPHTNRKAKFKRGEQKVKAQTRSAKPVGAEGFQGVAAIKPHITHSRKLA